MSNLKKLFLFLPGLQKSEPEFRFSEDVHSSQVSDHLQANWQGDGGSQLTQELVQHGIASGLDALKTQINSSLKFTKTTFKILSSFNQVSDRSILKILKE